jgi:hypothetical protein
MALSMATRKAITREMAQRCVRARKLERGRMLDELCALTGYNRSYAARLLRLRARAPARSAGARRRDRGRIYGPETHEPLRKCWAVAGGICGKPLSRHWHRLIVSRGRTSTTPDAGLALLASGRRRLSHAGGCAGRLRYVVAGPLVSRSRVHRDAAAAVAL